MTAFQCTKPTKIPLARPPDQGVHGSDVMITTLLLLPNSFTLGAKLSKGRIPEVNSAGPAPTRVESSPL